MTLADWTARRNAILEVIELASTVRNDHELHCGLPRTFCAMCAAHAAILDRHLAEYRQHNFNRPKED